MSKGKLEEHPAKRKPTVSRAAWKRQKAAHKRVVARVDKALGPIKKPKKSKMSLAVEAIKGIWTRINPQQITSRLKKLDKS